MPEDLIEAKTAPKNLISSQKSVVNMQSGRYRYERFFQ